MWLPIRQSQSFVGPPLSLCERSVARPLPSCGLGLLPRVPAGRRGDPSSSSVYSYLPCELSTARPRQRNPTCAAGPWPPSAPDDSTGAIGGGMRYRRRPRWRGADGRRRVLQPNMKRRLRPRCWRLDQTSRRIYVRDPANTRVDTVHTAPACAAARVPGPVLGFL